MTEKYIKASECEKYFYEHLDDNGMIGAMNAIDEMPAANVQSVKRGKWNKGHCSSCGEDIASRLDTWTNIQSFKFCPICGALMTE